jgi:uncharacterized protein (DUF983 family)
MASPPDPPPLTTWRVLGRGLRKRCPLCGGGDVFESWFRKRDRCPRCNFPMERIEGNWIGALGMNTIVTFGLLALVLLVGMVLTWPDIAVAPIIVTGIAVALLVPVLFLPASHTLWSAIDLLMRPPDPDDDIDPEWIPPAHPERRAGW